MEDLSTEVSSANPPHILDTDNTGSNVSIINTSNTSNTNNKNDNNSPISIIYNTTMIGGKLLNRKYTINFDSGNSDINSVGNNNSSTDNRNKIHNEHRSSVLGEISKSCKLYKEFEAGIRRLEHSELLGIGTNLIQVESGITRFIEILHENRYYCDREWKYEK